MASDTVLTLLPLTGFSYVVMANFMFYIALLLVACVSLMLYYHWFRYGISIAGTFFVMVLYGVGTLFLLSATYGLLLQL